MSFKEKSIWISLVTTILVFGYYFVRVLQMVSNEAVGNAEIAVFFVSIIVLVIVIQIISHILLTIAHRPETEDERDQIIELKATRNAYYLLIAGVFASTGTFIIGIFVLPVTTFHVVHTMLIFFIIAEMVKHITELVHYRRGI